MDIKLAERLSKSRFVPKEFRGQPEDLYFVLDFVERLKGEVSLLQALRGIYFSNGEPSMKAHLLLSLINNEQISPFKGGVTWKVNKTEDDLEVTASVETKGEVQSETLKLSVAKRAYFRNNLCRRVSWNNNSSFNSSCDFGPRCRCLGGRSICWNGYSGNDYGVLLHTLYFN